MIPEEARKRSRAVAEATSALKRSVETWTPAADPHSAPSNILLESCVMPRVFFSPEDAMHCGEMLLQAFRLFSFHTSFLAFLSKVGELPQNLPHAFKQ